MARKKGRRGCTRTRSAALFVSPWPTQGAQRLACAAAFDARASQEEASAVYVDAGKKGWASYAIVLDRSRIACIPSRRPMPRVVSCLRRPSSVRDTSRSSTGCCTSTWTLLRRSAPHCEAYEGIALTCAHVICGMCAKSRGRWLIGGRQSSAGVKEAEKINGRSVGVDLEERVTMSSLSMDRQLEDRPDEHTLLRLQESATRRFKAKLS